MTVTCKINSEECLQNRKKIFLDWFEEQLFINRKELKSNIAISVIASLVASLVALFILVSLGADIFAIVCFSILAFFAVFVNIDYFFHVRSQILRNRIEQYEAANKWLLDCGDGDLHDLILVYEEFWHPVENILPLHYVDSLLRMAKGTVLRVTMEQDCIFTYEQGGVVMKFSIPIKYVVGECVDIGDDVLVLTEEGVLYQKKYIASL